MNTDVQTPIPAQVSIHPKTRIGAVSLTVADLEGQVRFYQEVLGLQLHHQADQTAALGAGGEDLLHLTGLPQARRSRGVTGLYHLALLFPNRRELARAIARLFALRYPNSPTDHIMTKTTYLDDPEGNTIELYAESPEDGMFGLQGGVLMARRADGTLSDGREPLDVDALFRLLDSTDRLDQPAPPETRIGHVHLHVADLDDTLAFYHGLLGFDNMGLARLHQMGMVSAGGYHHHIGFNTWKGKGASFAPGAPPPLPDSLGLRYFTVVLPEPAELERLLARLRAAGQPVEPLESGYLVRDPSQIGVLLTSEQ